MQVLISVIDHETGSATHDEMAAIRAFNDRLRQEGRWVFAGGLESPQATTVVDARGDRPQFSSVGHGVDAEYVSGFWIVDADDRDHAVALGVEASRACNRRVQVRPLLG